MLKFKNIVHYNKIILLSQERNPIPLDDEVINSKFRNLCIIIKLFVKKKKKQFCSLEGKYIYSYFLATTGFAFKQLLRFLFISPAWVDHVSKVSN